jgi:hypothetical protein
MSRPSHPSWFDETHKCSITIKNYAYYSKLQPFLSTWSLYNQCGSGGIHLVAARSVIVHSLSYEVWPLLEHTTANHNSGVGTTFSRSLQLQLGSSTRHLYREEFSVVKNHCESGLTHLNRLWQHLWVRLYTTWPDRNWPRITRIQSAHPVE